MRVRLLVSLALLGGLLAAAPVPSASAAVRARPCTLPVPEASGPWAQRLAFSLRQVVEARRAGHRIANRVSLRETARARRSPRARRRPRPVRPSGRPPRLPRPAAGEPAREAAAATPRAPRRPAADVPPCGTSMISAGPLAELYWLQDGQFSLAV